MVKFQHQLEGQLVSEWRSAYINYKALKRELKLVRDAVGKDRTRRGWKRASPRSAQLALAGFRDEQLTRRLLDFAGPTAEVVESGGNSGRTEIRYHTEIPSDVEHRAEEARFFGRLDHQLTKVNSFYARKEREYTSHFRQLMSQLAMLDEFARDLEGFSSPAIRRAVSTPPRTPNLEPEPDTDSSSRRDSDPEVMPVFTTGGPGLISQSETSPESQGPSSPKGHHNSSSAPSAIRFRKSSSSLNVEHKKEGKAAALLGDARDALSKVAAVVGGADDWEQLKKVQKKEHAEKILKAALVEFYRGLGLLRNYRSLNALGFGKILKKHDKVAGWSAAPAYMAVVESSHFHSSDRVENMMLAVEREFAAHLANGSHRQAMVSLRPVKRRSSHIVTFFLGLSCGSMIALLIWLVSILARFVQEAPPSHPLPSGGATFTVALFPAYRALTLLIIHLYMSGFDVYFWRRARVNYPFIFDFQPGTELHHREIWLAASAVSVVVLGGMVGHLVLLQSPGRLAEGDWQLGAVGPDLMPAAIMLFFLVILVCPFNILFKSSRRCLVKALRRVISAPFCKVTLLDFFMADQLTSQVTMLWDLQYSACYYATSSYKTRDTSFCTQTMWAKMCLLLVGMLPYWFRLAQCIRRYIDENHDPVHILNGLKYLLSLATVVSRRLYLDYHYQSLQILWIIVAVAATSYSCYWDLVRDWGFLQRNAQNWLLRDKLMLKEKWVYYVSMVLNLSLRLAWVQSITGWHLGALQSPHITLIAAALEVIRRGQWNFYRLENEHLNNCGKYRAVKDIPLPFDISSGPDV